MEEPRKDCPFCGCKGEDLEHDELYINHECCGFVEWNEWNNRPIEDDLRARLAASDAHVAELKGLLRSVVLAANAYAIARGHGCADMAPLDKLLRDKIIAALRGKEVQGE